MSTPALVTTEWLAQRLGDPSMKVAEVFFERPDEQSGPCIPGSLMWYWRDVLWDDLARQFPSPIQMAERLAACGISNETTLVFCSREPQFAAYGAWVTGVMCGHPDVRILDGGMTKWLAEGRPVGEPTSNPAKTDYRPNCASRDDSSRVALDEVHQKLGSEGVTIVDVRSEEEYMGLRVMPPPGFDHGAERAGRIPGAVHVPFTDLMRPDGSFRPVEELKSIFEALGAAPTTAQEVIVYCRLGHRASLAWYAMTHLVGWPHVRVYDGSWTEWGNRVGMPIER